MILFMSNTLFIQNYKLTRARVTKIKTQYYNNSKFLSYVIYIIIYHNNDLECVDVALTL